MNAENSRKSIYIKIIIVALIVQVYFFSYFQRVAVPGTVFNELQTDFSAPASVITMLGALVFYLYASLQIFNGYLADRLGAGRILLFGGAVMAAGSLLFPMAHSIGLLYTSRILVGLGASFIYVSMVKEIDELFAEHHFAMMLCLAMFFGYFGGLAGTYPVERAVAAFGWRKTFLVAGVFNTLVILGVGYALYKTHRLHTGNTVFSLGQVKAVLLNRHAIPLIVCGSLNFSLYFLIQAAIGKKLLQDCYTFSSASAATLTCAMMLVNMVSVGISGFISRLFQNRRKPIILFASVLPLVWTSMVLLSLKDMLSPAWLTIGFLLAAVSTGFGPIFNSVMKEMNATGSAGTAIGYSNGAAYLAMAIVTNVTGIVMDCYRSSATVMANATIYPRQAYIVIFVGAIVVAAITFLFSLFVAETHGKHIYERTA